MVGVWLVRSGSRDHTRKLRSLHCDGATRTPLTHHHRPPRCPPPPCGGRCVCGPASRRARRCQARRPAAAVVAPAALQERRHLLLRHPRRPLRCRCLWAPPLAEAPRCGSRWQCCCCHHCCRQHPNATGPGAHATGRRCRCCWPLVPRSALPHALAPQERQRAAAWTWAAHQLAALLAATGWGSRRCRRRRCWLPMALLAPTGWPPVPRLPCPPPQGCRLLHMLALVVAAAAGELPALLQPALLRLSSLQGLGGERRWPRLLLLLLLPLLLLLLLLLLPLLHLVSWLG